MILLKKWIWESPRAGTLKISTQIRLYWELWICSLPWNHFLLWEFPTFLLNKNTVLFLLNFAQKLHGLSLVNLFFCTLLKPIRSQGTFSILPEKSLVRCTGFYVSFLFSMFVPTLFSLTCLPTSNLGCLFLQPPATLSSPSSKASSPICSQGPSAPAGGAELDSTSYMKKCRRSCSPSVTHHKG